MLQPKKKRAKMRKTMSGLIMLTLLSSLILPGAAGARLTVPSQIEFSNVSVQAGQSVKVPVKLTQNEYPVNAYNMQIDYDKSTLEVVRITPAASGNIASSSTDGDVPDFQYQINNAEGWVRIIWVNSKDISQEDSGLIDAGQPLFEMEIKAKSNAAPGTTQLTVVQDDKEHWRFNNLEYSPPAELSGGTITITAASSGGNSSSPSTGSSGGGTVSTPVSSAPSTPVATKGVDIYVNGQKQEQSATASTSTAGNKVTTTIHVDNNKVINQVGNGLRTLLLPVTGTGTNTVVGELNAKLVKTMEGSNAEVVIQTDTGTYTLPASQIKVDQVVKQLGSTAPLEDVTIQIAIAPSNETKKAAIEAAASKIGNTTVVAAPVDFEVKAVYNGQQVDVNRFNAYVERSITLPEGVDGSKITTGLCFKRTERCCMCRPKSSRAQ